MARNTKNLYIGSSLLSAIKLKQKIIVLITIIIFRILESEINSESMNGPRLDDIKVFLAENTCDLKYGEYNNKVWEHLSDSFGGLLSLNGISNEMLLVGFGFN